MKFKAKHSSKWWLIYKTVQFWSGVIVHSNFSHPRNWTTKIIRILRPCNINNTVNYLKVGWINYCDKEFQPGKKLFRENKKKRNLKTEIKKKSFGKKKVITRNYNRNRWFRSLLDAADVWRFSVFRWGLTKIQLNQRVKRIHH